jgi:hypothetical protein
MDADRPNMGTECQFSTQLNDDLLSTGFPSPGPHQRVQLGRLPNTGNVIGTREICRITCFTVLRVSIESRILSDNVFHLQRVL